MVTYLEGIVLKKHPWLFSKVAFRDHVTNQNYYISTISLPIVTKRVRVVTYLEVLLPKSHMALDLRGLARLRDKLKPL